MMHENPPNLVPRLSSCCRCCQERLGVSSSRQGTDGLNGFRGAKGTDGLNVERRASVVVDSEK